MICSGTLLGANGVGKNSHFFSWDDDFDACVFEEVYDKAVECLIEMENGLSDRAILRCVKLDPN